MRFVRAWHLGVALFVAIDLFLLVTSPLSAVAYIAIGVTIWWLGPHISTEPRWLILRHAAFFAVVVFGLPFVIASPRHLAFWIVLAVLALTLGPLISAFAWFSGEIRRARRNLPPNGPRGV